MTTYDPIHFLLAEDDDGHAQLLELAMHEDDCGDTLTRVRDGTEALAYVRQERQYADAKPPDVILLDLNMPRMNGLEVLDALKSEPRFRSIPVVILTTSAAESDRALAYEKHANSYLVKPLEYDKFEQMIRDMKFYWAAWNQSARNRDAA